MNKESKIEKQIIRKRNLYRSFKRKFGKKGISPHIKAILLVLEAISELYKMQRVQNE